MITEYLCQMERKVDQDPGAPVVAQAAAPVVARALVLVVAPTVKLKRRERMEFSRK